MAATVTVTKLLETSKRSIIHVAVTGDAAGDVTGSVLYDFSTDAEAPASIAQLHLERVWASVDDTVSIDLLWDQTTPFRAWGSPQYTPSRDVDFSFFGGIKNPNGTGSTGDLTLNTVGLTTGEHFYLILDIRKN